MMVNGFIEIHVLKRVAGHGVFLYEYVENAGPFSQRLLGVTLER